jgi:signal transduction histidine kinase
LKKLLYFLPISILLFYSCKKTKPVAKTVDLWADYRKATTFLYKQNDSAFYYFNRVVNTSKDTIQVAGALNQMAAIQSDAGDYFGSEESISMSLKLLNENNVKHRSALASDYNELGMDRSSLKDYDAAIGYYDAAIKFSMDSMGTLVFMNNQANVYQKKKDFPKALKLYEAVLAKSVKGGTAYARVLSNMARTKWLANPGYNAAPELLKALLIRQKEKDLYGENASYRHLADYYSNSNPDSALVYAARLYKIASRIESPDDQLEALKTQIKLAPLQDTKQYFVRYQQLSDSLQTARNAAKNQFALIRYNSEKSKADNLTLQKDNTLKRYLIIKQQVLLAAVLFALIGGGIFLAFWYRKRKQRLQMEAERTIRESQLKTSKRVHDVVANGLYRMMTEIEHREHLDKEELLDQIESMYEQSRDISYEKQPLGPENFHDNIAKLLGSFANSTTKVVIVSNSELTWANVALTVREQIRHVILELMINMKKHSKASHVAVRFELKEKQLFINYTDNGIGLPKDVAYGNGLSSAGHRIKAIEGEINFENGLENGLRVRMSIPTV